ncbi:putative gustatory receptor 28b [Temnothorax nylanderi]|uniref:putative gustatory receptor 28b n=1 Tax=Temnothorax nylanderi TaxID=102681 RepID=UPI003A84D3B0
MHLHLELCQIARDINGFFGMQMTLQMISYFVVVNGWFYFQYYIILHLKEMYENDIALKVLLSVNMWFITFLMKLVSLSHICESVSAKARKTKNVVNRLTNMVGFAEVREEISQFVLQILLRPLKFSGLGLFYFGYDFIRKFFAWIVTVVLFMVQLDVFPIAQVLDNMHNITCYKCYNHE